MPSFHTKTIESILEPVAQQVAHLIILHEQSEDGKSMPDLTIPVRGVSIAVINLVNVGRETVATSRDLQLREDLPPALSRVEEASSLLLTEAAATFLTDPFSAVARRQLIDGCRGILQGTSQLLLSLDKSEVRKIVRIAKSVEEYVMLCETVEFMEQLVEFIQNLNSVMKTLTTCVSNRQEELTHSTHREMLTRNMDHIQAIIPTLISSLKICIHSKDTGGVGYVESRENRNYLVDCLVKELRELIRVLQLTSEQEDEESSLVEFNPNGSICRYEAIRTKSTVTDNSIGGLNSSDVLSRLRAALQRRAAAAQLWLSDSSVAAEKEQDLYHMLHDAMHVAKRCAKHCDCSQIEILCVKLRHTADQLKTIRCAGREESVEAVELRNVGMTQLAELVEACTGVAEKSVGIGINCGSTAVSVTNHHSLQTALQAAQGWLRRPDNAAELQSGPAGVASLVSEARRLELVPPALTQQIDADTQRLVDLMHAGHVDSGESRQLVRSLAPQLHQIHQCIKDATLVKISEAFTDVSGPLTALRRCSPESASVNSLDLVEHTEKLCRAAEAFVQQGCQRRLADALLNMCADLRPLSKQLAAAARLRVAQPGPQADDHFQMLADRWHNTADQLRQLIDHATDTAVFISAQEVNIEKASQLVEQGIHQANPSIVVDGVSSIARRANRVLQIAQQEVDNSEDAVYVDRVSETVRQLRATIRPAVEDGKSLAMALGSVGDAAFEADRWRGSNHGIMQAVNHVRQAVEPNQTSAAQPPDVSMLQINNKEAAKVCLTPPLRVAPPVAPRPVSNRTSSRLSSTSDGSDMEEVFNYPVATENQPILKAAHELHQEAVQWSSRDNSIVAAAKRMAHLMAQLSQIVRGEWGTKKDLIGIAKEITLASQEVSELGLEMAHLCTDKRMKENLRQTCARIPTISTQLKILSTVKATMLGASDSTMGGWTASLAGITSEHYGRPSALVPVYLPTPAAAAAELDRCGSEEDQEATEMLVGNAQNLMIAVKESVLLAEAASIKMRADAGSRVLWNRREPWYGRGHAHSSGARISLQHQSNVSPVAMRS